jgi:transcriptional regulator with XRE-family HTH domain
MRFGEKLKSLRKSTNLTQEQVATAAGIPIGSYRNLEQGQRGPGWATVVKLAKALGTDCTAFADCDEVSESEKSPAKKPKGKPKK